MFVEIASYSGQFTVLVDIIDYCPYNKNELSQLIYRK